MILFRTDGSLAIGTGHVMRSLALAQAWRRAGRESRFLMAQTSEALVERVVKAGFEVVHLEAQPGSPEDIEKTLEVGRGLNPDWVVLDGYSFGADFQQALRDAGTRLLFVDDFGHAAAYPADIVLNQNLHAKESLYKNREPYTKLLLGPRYALLREEFLRWRGHKREVSEKARKVLVSLGGADPQNVTKEVIEALHQSKVEGLEAKVIVGPANPNQGLLKKKAARGPATVKLLYNVDDMPSLMAWADIAVSAGGSTVWELCFMGVPSAVLVLAENQEGTAEWLADAGAAINLGWFDELHPPRVAETLREMLDDYDLRLNMVEKVRGLVDGEGADRAVQILQTQLNPSNKEIV